jgi:cation diffusion facilitator CzcD-associated flavoprotein CzcO
MYGHRMSVQCHDAVIVGAGFSGMAAAIELKKLGFDDIVIVEREDDIGGTWHVNRYPGAAVDIMSSSYQYWFEKNPGWTRIYAHGPELKQYATDVCDKYDLRRHVILNTAVECAVWDEDAKVWRVTVATGEQLVARFVINASGFLSQRHYPDIDGLHTFAGEVLHTTWWDTERDLSGRRIGAIGTGATSVQLLPELARDAGSLTVYQRTPIWVTPKMDMALPGALRRLFMAVPLLAGVLRLLSESLYRVVLASAVLNYRRFSILARVVELQCRAMLFLRVRDRKVRKQLTPDYSFGCKRPSISNVYYAMFNKPNVHLQTSGIDHIEADGIVARDGTKAQIDTLILATGFNVWDHNFPAFETIGRGRVDLGKWWKEHRYASYQGITVPEFPNYIAMTSPWAFTGVSFFDTIQAQSVHIRRLLGEIRRRGAITFEVTDSATERFVTRMRAKLDDTVLFQGTCATSNSYYFNGDGDAAWFRPTSTRAALREHASFPFSDYVIV